jgi:hypothetical protein
MDMTRIQSLLLAALAVFFLAFSAPALAQPGNPGYSEEDALYLKTMEDTLALLAYAIVNDSMQEMRFAATQKFIPSLVQALKVPNSFAHPFKRLQTISIQYPADSSFRVFTWQLYVDENDYRYYGAIQMNSPELKLFPLIDRSGEMPLLTEQEILKPERWYGSLCYRLYQFDAPEGRHYLYFGFDAKEFYSRRKLMDVLYFEQGEPRFGAPVFVDSLQGGGVHTRNRIILDYYAEASVKLSYDDALGMVIFDNLIDIPGPEGPIRVPDGSYVGYQLGQGRWVRIEKVFDHVYETAPRPEPVLDARKDRDILGKEAKKKRN